jgi:hypothetical protein
LCTELCLIINVAAEALALLFSIVVGILLSTGRVFQLTAPLVTVAGFGRSGFLFFFLADAIKLKKKKAGSQNEKKKHKLRGLRDMGWRRVFFSFFEIEGVNACAVGKAQHVVREFH